MGEAGAPSALDNVETWRKIKAAVLEGANFVELSEILGISYDTVRDWNYENFRGFRDKVDGWRRDHMLQIAERNIKEDMLMDTTVPVVSMAGIVLDPKTGQPVKKISPELRKIRMSQSQFAAETLGSATYSKKIKNEHSGGLTLEDLFDKADEEDNKEAQEPSEGDASAFVDSEQEAAGATVPTEPGATGLPQAGNTGAPS